MSIEFFRPDEDGFFEDKRQLIAEQMELIGLLSYMTREAFDPQVTSK